MPNIETIQQSRSWVTVAASSLAIILLLFTPVSATAQGSNWRVALQNEKAKNAERLAAIELQGAPIAAKLQEVNKEVERHNTNRCTYPADQPEVCAWYENERVRLDTQTEGLRSQLIPLVEEQERLQARNMEIERRLRCVQLPIPCSSNSDCQCSQSCAAFADGRRNDPGICQPRP